MSFILTGGGTPPSKTRQQTVPSGSAKNKTFKSHKFVCIGTVDKKIDEMIETKRHIAGAIVGKGDDWLTKLSTEKP